MVCCTYRGEREYQSLLLTSDLGCSSTTNWTRGKTLSPLQEGRGCSPREGSNRSMCVTRLSPTCLWWQHTFLVLMSWGGQICGGGAGAWGHPFSRCVTGVPLSKQLWDCTQQSCQRHSAFIPWRISIPRPHDHHLVPLTPHIVVVVIQSTIFPFFSFNSLIYLFPSLVNSLTMLMTQIDLNVFNWSIYLVITSYFLLPFRWGVHLSELGRQRI